MYSLKKGKKGKKGQPQSEPQSQQGPSAFFEQSSAGSAFGPFGQNNQRQLPIAKSLFGGASTDGGGTSAFATKPSGSGGAFEQTHTTCTSTFGRPTVATGALGSGGLFGRKPATPTGTVGSTSTGCANVEPTNRLGAIRWCASPAASQPSAFGGGVGISAYGSFGQNGNHQQQHTPSVFGDGMYMFGHPAQQQEQQQNQPRLFDTFGPPMETNAMNANGTMRSRDSVFAVEELQDRIFSYNLCSDSARCAQVCRGWKEVALDHAWRDVYSMKQLLSLLAELTPADEDEYQRFSRPLRPSDWKRFIPYAKRVQTLQLFAECLDSEVFHDLALSRPVFHILPNLVHLGLRIDDFTSFLSCATLFLHDNVQSFAFFIPDDWEAGIIEHIIEEFSARRPTIRTVHAEAVSPSPETLDILGNYFLSLSLLESLTVSSSILSPSLLSSLGALKHIKKIGIKPEDDSEQDADVPGFQHVHIDESMFPQLRSLALQSTLQDISCFFVQGPSFGTLVDLSIYKSCGCDAPSLRSLLEVLSSTSSTLERLWIGRRTPTISDAGVIDGILSSESSFITDDTLKPLTRFPLLRDFSVAHAQPVNISDSSLSDILSECTALRVLELNADPLSAKHTSLTLGILGMLAERRTNLQHLSIYVDTSQVPVGNLAASRISRRLETLSFGRSLISNPPLVTAYLAQVLPLSCIVKSSSVTSCHSSHPTETQLDGWQMVISALPILIHDREESRGRVDSEVKASLDARDEEIQHLRAQVEDLRVRLREQEPESVDVPEPASESELELKPETESEYEYEPKPPKSE